MRHLRTHVHVQDEHGVSVAFGPHDDVPSWAADKITNPKAWDDDPADADQTEPASDRDAADPHTLLFDSELPVVGCYVGGRRLALEAD